ncbi:MAG: hypothetical protein JO332_11540, partial [Planctomycetaceae bacterium]|nr:hypothetical protein [Planctomycetaceae bacterium]
KKVDGIEMNEVFEESEEDVKPTEVPKPAAAAVPAGETKPAEPPKEEKK